MFYYHTSTFYLNENATAVTVISFINSWLQVKTKCDIQVGITSHAELFLVLIILWLRFIHSKMIT